MYNKLQPSSVSLIMNIIKIFWGIVIFIAIWQSIIIIFEPPKFLLPSPFSVEQSFVKKYSYILADAKITGLEILLGMIIGSALGILNGLLLQSFKMFKKAMLPVLVVSQSIPMYALAPILVLWLGYDLAPKVAMAVIIIFFPVTTAFYDGLRQTNSGYLDLAQTMRASKLKILFKVRLPYALPALGSGLRVAAAFAPIGAIVGEWVGASAGLGYRMIYANARMQTADMFSALIALVIMALSLYYFVNYIVRKLIPWKNDSLNEGD